MIDFSKARRKPYAHQVTGVEWLTEFVDPEVGRIFPGCHLLADEMRLGKTKQVIDAACVMYERDEIDQVIVVCPAPVRSVWYDEDLGEIQKHMWLDVPFQVVEYHNGHEYWGRWEKGKRSLRWLITNYEFISHNIKRKDNQFTGWNLDTLVQMANNRTWLVLDESSWIKSFGAKRTKACLAIRAHCRGVVELNGTPIAQSPGDLFSQSFMMHQGILGAENQYQFNAIYSKQKKVMLKSRQGSFNKILGWPGLVSMQEKLKPYTLRRIRSECLDLPPKLDPVTMTVTLSNESWKKYNELREDMITWLSENQSVSGAQAAVRVMRLAQLTSGFLGGVEEEVVCPCQSNQDCPLCGGAGFTIKKQEPMEVGREKIDTTLDWIYQRAQEEPDFRMLIWCRFRPELFRLERELNHIASGFVGWGTRCQVCKRYREGHSFPLRVASIHGGQKSEVRDAALRLMHPDTPAYPGAAILLGTIGTGSVGLNMAGAHEVIYSSNGNSLYHRKQSEDRPHGPGQTQPVSYHDIIAEGPKGQRTIDHLIVKALHDRDEIAQWTTSAWVTKLILERDE